MKKSDDWRSRFDAPPAPPKGSLQPTAKAPNQGRGGAAALLRNRGRSIDEMVDRMSNGQPAKSYQKGGSPKGKGSLEEIKRTCTIKKPSW